MNNYSIHKIFFLKKPILHSSINVQPCKNNETGKYYLALSTYACLCFGCSADNFWLHDKLLVYCHCKSCFQTYWIIPSGSAIYLNSFFVTSIMMGKNPWMFQSPYNYIILWKWCWKGCICWKGQFVRMKNVHPSWVTASNKWLDSHFQLSDKPFVYFLFSSFYILLVQIICVTVLSK